MARTRRSLDERIEEQEQVVSKAREHYESEVNKLEQLMNKRDELQKRNSWRLSKTATEASRRSCSSFGETLQRRILRASRVNS